MLAAFTLALRVPVPSSRAAGPQRLDLTGAVLLAGALAVLVHTLSGVPAYGWGAARTLFGLAVAAVASAGFGVHEHRAAYPIVPAAVARSVPVTASMVMLLVSGEAMFGALFATTFHLQDVLGLDALASGMRVMPMTALMVLGAPVASRALRRYGACRTAVVGVALVSAALAALALTLTGAGPAGPAGAWGAFGLLGAGFATVMVTTTETVVGDAPPGYAGVVGGLKQTAMNIGPVFGIAVAASMMPSRSAAFRDAFVLTPTLSVLAGLAALGLVPALLLPGGQTRGRKFASADRT
ncbi:hypothetical protein [Streptomyces cremeus]|uniref:Major facilitator superfamily (MFS) profile domain-containing protein n=1 Tax=Streptomyces cremeus TaxID=66881 RepID=A0ABV5PDQ6_STRCM